MTRMGFFVSLDLCGLRTDQDPSYERGLRDITSRALLKLLSKVWSELWGAVRSCGHLLRPVFRK